MAGMRDEVLKKRQQKERMALMKRSIQESSARAREASQYEEALLQEAYLLGIKHATESAVDALQTFNSGGEEQ